MVATTDALNELPEAPVDADGEAVTKGEEFLIGGQKVIVHGGFFRGDTTTFHPIRDDMRQPEGIGRFILHGWVPAVSAAKGGETILALGGDLLEPLLAAAADHGLVPLALPAGLAAQAADAAGLRSLLAAACEGKGAKLGEKKKAALRTALDRADIILLCLSGRSAKRPGHAQTVEDITESYRLLRARRPDALIILAVSPVPPAETPAGTGPAIFVAAEKATVRSAVDEMYRQAEPGDAKLHYFPAFELVNVGLNFAYEGDRRTLAPHGLALLGAAFAHAFGVGVDDQALADAHVAARQADMAACEALRANPPVAAQVPAAAPGMVCWPDEAAMADYATLDEFVFQGLLPPAPFVNADRTLIAFGSCFANNISRYLNMIGYNVATRRDAIAYVSRMGDGIVNTYGIRQQFEWAWEGKVPQVELWHDYKAAEFGYDEGVRIRTRELFDIGDVFIITLGLSEVWYDEPTGEVFWRAVPADRYDPSRHKFRMVSQAESLQNIEAIYRLIRTHRPEAKVVFTVSPIPMMATFRGKACIVASAVSKAILRSAVDEFFKARRDDPGLFYFPAYEVVTGCFHEPFANDMRHPFLHTVLLNMKIFERHFCDSGVTDAAIAEFFEEVHYRDLALNGEDRPMILERLKIEADEWRGDGQVPCIESVARSKARQDLAAARQRERDAQTTERQHTNEAKRAELLASRQAAAEERRLAADDRRAQAEAARAARARPAR